MFFPNLCTFWLIGFVQICLCPLFFLSPLSINGSVSYQHSESISVLQFITVTHSLHFPFWVSILKWCEAVQTYLGTITSFRCWSALWGCEHREQPWPNHRWPSLGFGSELASLLLLLKWHQHPAWLFTSTLGWPRWSCARGCPLRVHPGGQAACWSNSGRLSLSKMASEWWRAFTQWRTASTSRWQLWGGNLKVTFSVIVIWVPRGESSVGITV